MAIQATMSGAELDRILRAFLDAETTDNNGKVCYIRRGASAFETWATLSDIVQLGG